MGMMGMRKKGSWEREEICDTSRLQGYKFLLGIGCTLMMNRFDSCKATSSIACPKLNSETSGPIAGLSH